MQGSKGDVDGLSGRGKGKTIWQNMVYYHM